MEATPSRISKGQKSGIQSIAIVLAGNELLRQMPSGASLAGYRQIRRDPTIALARYALGSTVASAAWSYETDDDVPDDRLEFIQSTLDAVRPELVESAIYGMIDYGCADYEQVFDVDGDGRVILARVKPLLNDITILLVDMKSGDLMGARQRVTWTAIPVELSKPYHLHFEVNVEGTNHYGVALLENVRATQNKWIDCDDAANRFDQKQAGSHWFVYYPPGTTLLEGVETDNAAVAAVIAKALQSSGTVTIPRAVSSFIDAVPTSLNPGWEVVLVEARGGQQADFVQRLKYLDSLKVRGLMVPERAMLEGQFGTKAEAGEHAGILMQAAQSYADYIARVMQPTIDLLMEQNFGAGLAGTIRLKAAPVVDAALVFLQALYLQLAQAPAEQITIDTDGLKDRLDVGKRSEVAQAQALATIVELRPPAPTGSAGPGKPGEKKEEVAANA